MYDAAHLADLAIKNIYPRKKEIFFTVFHKLIIYAYCAKPRYDLETRCWHSTIIFVLAEEELLLNVGGTYVQLLLSNSCC